MMVDPEEKAFLESLKEFMNSNRYLKAKQQKLSFFESKTACHFVEGFAYLGLGSTRHGSLNT